MWALKMGQPICKTKADVMKYLEFFLANPHMLEMVYVLSLGTLNLKPYTWLKGISLFNKCLAINFRPHFDVSSSRAMQK